MNARPVTLSSTITPPPNAPLGNGDLTSLMKDAVAAAKEGNKARARILFRRALEVVPDHEVTWLWLGNLAESVPETIECLRRVLQINPENVMAKKSLPEALIRAGIVAAQAKDNNLAWEYLLEATELEPTNETALVWLSGVAASPHEGTKILEQVLRINPKNEQALQGILHFERERLESWQCPLCCQKAVGPDQGRCPRCHAILVLDPPDLFDSPGMELDRTLLEANAKTLLSEYQQCPESETAFLLGLIYLNLNDETLGFRYLKESLSPVAANPKWVVLVPAFIKYRKTIASQRAAAAEHKRLSGKTRNTIMVVSARRHDRAIVKMTLGMAGYTVVEASDGDSIGQKIREAGVPQLFILDSALPKVGGYFLADFLKQNPDTSGVPVLFLTGKRKLLQRLSAPLQNHSHSIPVPIDPELLIRRVRVCFKPQ